MSEMVRLGDVVNVSASNLHLPDDDIWLLNLDMVEQQTGNIIDYNFVPKEKLNGSIIQFDTENVLYSKLRPNLNKVVIPIMNGYATSEMLPLRPNLDFITKEYLCAYLRSDSFVTWAVSKTSGAKMPRLGTKELLSKTIPFPPLPEQRHIAAVLDKVSELIALRKRQLDLLDEMVKARFVEMFGDPFSNPMKWERKRFKDVCTRLSDGPFGSNLKSEHYSENGIRVIRLGNIGTGVFIDEDKAFIPLEHYEKLKKYTCKTGEIIIGTLGEPNLRACLIPSEIGIAINKADCVHYIPIKELLNTRFVCQYINSPETLLLAQTMIHGQTRTRISSGQIGEMPIFIPPMELQTQFADFVQQVEKSKAAVQQGLDRLNLLKSALMQEYFG